MPTPKTGQLCWWLSLTMACLGCLPWASMPTPRVVTLTDWPWLTTLDIDAHAQDPFTRTSFLANLPLHNRMYTQINSIRMSLTIIRCWIFVKKRKMEINAIILSEERFIWKIKFGQIVMRWKMEGWKVGRWKGRRWLHNIMWNYNISKKNWAFNKLKIR